MSTAAQAHTIHYAGPSFDAACVRDAMRIGVVSCRPETSLRDVSRIMVTHQIHSVLVEELGSGAPPWDMASALDIARSAACDLSSLYARDVASPHLATVPANETLEAAAKLMSDHRVTQLLAVHDTGRPVGVISALGLAAVVAASV